MSRRRTVIFALLLAGGAGGGWWWLNRASPPLQWQGYAEADYVKVGPTQQGLLMSLAVRRGSKVVVCDNCPADLAATISFISPQAEYTPPVIYSESIRAKLVYLVEARPLPEQAAMINPGQPIAVRPTLAAGGQPVHAAQAGR